MTHDPTCGAMQWFHPFVRRRERDDGRRRAARVQRLGARHEVERPEQALRVLRHVRVLKRRAARRTRRRYVLREGSDLRDRGPFPCSSCSTLHGSHRQSRADHRRQADRRSSSPRSSPKRGVDVALTYARSRAEAEQAVDASWRAASRARSRSQADLSQPEACDAAVAPGGRDVRAARHPDQHGVGLRAACRSTISRSRTGTPRWTSICAPPFSARTRRCRTCGRRRRPHHQLQRLGREERPAALSGFSAVLRRESRRASR